jgi:hypothetical protein
VPEPSSELEETSIKAEMEPKILLLLLLGWIWCAEPVAAA